MITRQPFLLASGILELMALAVAVTPAAFAETDAGGSGVIRAINLGTKQVTVRGSDNSSFTVPVKSTRQIVRNGKVVKLKALVLGDAIDVKYSAKTTVAKRLNATGAENTRVSDALANAIKGSGKVTIGNHTFVATAGTLISRNGRLVSLSQLTRPDKLTAHLKGGAKNAPQSNEAIDMIADGPDEGEV